MIKLDINTSRTLNLFCQKSHELLRSKFLNYIATQHTTVEISGGINKPPKVNIKFPDEEYIKSFILTLRMFLQPRDKISINKIKELLENNSSISIEVQKDFNEWESAINKYLESKSFLIHNGKYIIKKEILEVFLYGSYCHVNEDKHRIYESWKRNPGIEELMKMELIFILVAYTKFLAHLQYVFDNLIIENSI